MRWFFVISADWQDFCLSTVSTEILGFVRDSPKTGHSEGAQRLSCLDRGKGQKGESQTTFCCKHVIPLNHFDTCNQIYVQAIHFYQASSILSWIIVPTWLKCHMDWDHQEVHVWLWLFIEQITCDFSTRWRLWKPFVRRNQQIVCPCSRVGWRISNPTSGIRASTGRLGLWNQPGGTLLMTQVTHVDTPPKPSQNIKHLTTWPLNKLGLGRLGHMDTFLFFLDDLFCSKATPRMSKQNRWCPSRLHEHLSG